MASRPATAKDVEPSRAADRRREIRAARGRRETDRLVALIIGAVAPCA
jgi:hypothetical protein